MSASSHIRINDETDLPCEESATECTEAERRRREEAKKDRGLVQLGGLGRV
jgi:hypothetical protein